MANRDYKQNTSAKQRSRKLYTNMCTKLDCVVMDDETYVKADFKQLPGQEFYTASGKEKVSEIFKTIKLLKFPKKVPVWQAICTCGLKSGILISTGTINQEIYVQKCLKKRLLSFLKKHNRPVLFWPDLACCRYMGKRQSSGTMRTTWLWYPKTTTLPTAQNSALSNGIGPWSNGFSKKLINPWKPSSSLNLTGVRQRIRSMR